MPLLPSTPPAAAGAANNAAPATADTTAATITPTTPRPPPPTTTPATIPPTPRLATRRTRRLLSLDRLTPHAATWAASHPPREPGSASEALIEGCCMALPPTLTPPCDEYRRRSP